MIRRIPLHAAVHHTPTWPARTAFRLDGEDLVLRTWPTRESMMRALDAQAARAGTPEDWRAWTAGDPRPAVCMGPKKHAAYCRPGRPRCRWQRRVAGICHCEAYAFGHRDGSGRCGNPDAMDRYVHGPLPEEAMAAE